MSLLERFQAGSELDSVGEFTLDESKAREKMARFQLVTTEEFLMLVVQAAVASGCTALSITLEGPEVRVVAREALLDGDSVRTIGAFLFDSQPENVAYNLLAVAANAIEPTCLKPPLVAMVDDDLHFELTLLAPLPALTRVIKDRLRHFPCSLTLNNDLICTDPLCGQARLMYLPDGPSSVTLVRYGVVVARKAMSLPIEYRAVAPSDHLRLDASFSHVVEDDAYQQVMAELAYRANEKLAELARNYQPESHERTRLLQHLVAKHSGPAGEALRACPFFPLADRAGFTSFNEIQKQISERGKLLAAHRSYNLQLSVPVVRIDDNSLRGALQALLPPMVFQDADAEYREQVATERNKMAWEASPRPTELPPGRYLGQAQVQGLTWEAAIGFLAAPGGRSRVDVLYQGKLLTNESLDDVPPGAAAVLNVRQAQPDKTWSRLDGREYRAVLKELREKINRLFNGLIISDPADLYPSLAEHLLIQLGGKKPAQVALKAPLFPTLDGSRYLSVEQAAALQKVSFAHRIQLSERIPVASILPSPLLEYSPQRYFALSSRLGANKVSDLRELQVRLNDIDRQLASPKRAALPPGLYVIQFAFEWEGCTGQVGLTAEHGNKLRTTLMKQGVVFETDSVAGGKVLEAIAVAEAPQLNLTSHWTGFERDAEHSALMVKLRAQVEEMERGLIGQKGIRPETTIRLLRAYPQSKDVYWDLPLFATTTYGNFVSLRQLSQELTQYGHLLRGEPGIALPQRLALVIPGKEIASFLGEQLGEGNLRWEEAAVALRLYESARAFEEKPVHEVIKLSGSFPVRLPVPEGRGEMAFHLSQGLRSQGEVMCFVRGRYVCSKKGLIPAPFVAALESEAFVLRDDFEDVAIPESVKTMLEGLCGQCMLAAAVNRDAAVQNLAWVYFSKGLCDNNHKAQFRDLVKLTTIDGETITLATVSGGKIAGYVTPGFSTTVKLPGLVLRLWDSEAARLGNFLGRTLTILEATYEAEESYRRGLASLPRELPSRLFSRVFEGEGGLKAVLGVSMKRQIVGLNKEGEPVGLLRNLTMPVQAVVIGALPDAKKAKELVADLPAKGYAQLGKWADQLCLDWVKEKADDRELVLHLLLLSMREIGSKDNGRPLSEMATALWDLPLFRRVDGTQVSGSALAATLSETEQPIVVTTRTFRAPASAVVLAEGSEEYQVLNGVFGKSCLSFYEAPPLIDSAEVGSSIKRLASWGFSPLRKTAAVVGRLIEKSKKPKQERPKKRDPREVLVVELREDARNLLGRQLFKESDEMFQSLDYGHWPLGPPLWRPRGGKAFRLNALHAGVRWLLMEGGDDRHKRAARMMLLVHWVGMVNTASEELTDTHEDEFLSRVAERLAQTFQP